MTMREFELLTVSTIQQNVAPVIDSYLQCQGFSSVRPLQWVRSDDAPIRQLFEYRQLKGGALAPAWGYSFDFVPHFSGREMRWHRTEKSVLFDAFVDGQAHRDLLLTYMYGVGGLLENLHSRVAAAIRFARSSRETEGRAELERIVQEANRYPATELSDRTLAKVWKAFEDAGASAVDEAVP